MLKVLAIGDPHFQPSNLSDMERMIKRVRYVMEKEQPGVVVVLGDMLHTHEKVFTPCLNMSFDWLESMSFMAEVFLLVGNHCYINNSQFLTENHPYNALKKMKRVTVVDKVLYYENHNDSGVNLGFCPYVPPGRFLEALDTNPEVKNSNIIFAHQEFMGAKMGAIVSQNGDVYPEDYPLVVSGHIHDYSKLQNNILYVGTPLQHTYGDTPDKTVSLISLGKTEDKLKIRHKRVDLGLPRKITKILTPQEAETFEYIASDQIKVKIRCLASEWSAFKKTQTYKKMIEDGVRVVPDTIIEDKDHGLQEHEDYFTIMENQISSEPDNIKTVFGEINEINL